MAGRRLEFAADTIGQSCNRVAAHRGALRKGNTVSSPLCRFECRVVCADHLRTAFQNLIPAMRIIAASFERIRVGASPHQVTLAHQSIDRASACFVCFRRRSTAAAGYRHAGSWVYFAESGGGASFSGSVPGQMGGALFLSQGGHAGMHARSLRVSRSF